MRISTALIVALLGSAACRNEDIAPDQVDPSSAQAAHVMLRPGAQAAAQADITTGISITTAMLAFEDSAHAPSAPDAPVEPIAPSEPVVPQLVGGTVSGLVGGGLVLRNNAGDDLEIATDGAFQFATAVDTYAVSVAVQPTAPWQTCTVSHGAGSVIDAAIDNVSILCTLDAYKVGGTVSGLIGTLVLSNNGDELNVTADGAFQLPQSVESGNYYDVRIATQPAGQHCRVEAGGDIIDGHDSNGVVVTCATTECVNLGWKAGNADWTCPTGYRLPTADELARVSPCIDAVDAGRFTAYADIAISVGGCGCGWNADFCDAPSVQTMRAGQACGDYEQLHMCVRQ